MAAHAVIVLPKWMKVLRVSGATCTEIKAKTGTSLRCNLGSLAAGGSTSFSVLVSTGPKPVPTATTTATVGSSTADPVPGNNIDTETTTIVK